MRRPALLALLTAGLSLALVVGAAEALLRASGRAPFQPPPRPADEPTMHEPDAELGWRAKQGQFEVPAFSERGRPTRHTFDHRGARRTAERPPPRTDLLLVGGSYTQGFAVNDRETFAWRLQETFPEIGVENRGTSGYGTLQSLLVLERVYAESDPPRLVLYGMIGHHEIRNVGHPGWLRALDANARSGIVLQPHARLGSEGQLVRHAPAGHTAWPGRSTFASIAFLEESFAILRGRPHQAEAEAVTLALIQEMDALVRGRGSRFAVVLLTLTRERAADWRGLLAEAGIDTVDCARPLRRDELVPGEIHPNASAHQRFANCIAPFVRDALSEG